MEPGGDKLSRVASGLHQPTNHCPRSSSSTNQRWAGGLFSEGGNRGNKCV